MIASGKIENLSEARKIIKESMEIKEFINGMEEQ
jgi:hypothetical protein